MYPIVQKAVLSAKQQEAKPITAPVRALAMDMRPQPKKVIAPRTVTKLVPKLA